MSFDKDGYPTARALNKLKKWPSEDLKGALEYARSLWYYPHYVKVRGKKYTFITGGWSGNEQVISAIEENILLQSLCWLASYRGGKYIYTVPSVSSKKRK